MRTAPDGTRYEYIRPANGEAEFQNVRNNDVIERKLIDLDGVKDGIFGFNTGGGANGWRIRNIAVVGKPDFYTNPSQHNPKYDVIPVPRLVFRIGTNRGGRGVLENVWAADGSRDKATMGFCFAPRQHSGSLTVRNCNVQNWVDNGFYMTPAAKSSPIGEVIIDNVYANNNTTANYRLGEKGIVRNCVSIKDKKGPGKPKHNAPGYLDNCRGVWARAGPGPVRVENCQISHTYGGYAAIECDVNDDDGPGAAVVTGGNIKGPVGPRSAVTLRNVGSSPRLAIPAGVPKTPMEAITGSVAAPGTDPDPGPSPDPDPDPEPTPPTNRNRVFTFENVSNGSATYDMRVDGTTKRR